MGCSSSHAADVHPLEDSGAASAAPGPEASERPGNATAHSPAAGERRRAPQASKGKWSDLHEAAETGNVGEIQRQLRHCHPDAGDDKCWTPLLEASERGHLAAVQALLAGRSDPNVADNKGWTPLMAAAEFGHAEVAASLLQAGASPNWHDKQEWTCTMEAGEKRHAELVRLFIQHGAELNAADKRGWTAFMAACEGGNIDCVRLLWIHGSEHNLESSYARGWTALDEAKHKGHKDIVQFMQPIVDAEKSLRKMIDTDDWQPEEALQYLEKAQQVWCLKDIVSRATVRLSEVLQRHVVDKEASDREQCFDWLLSHDSEIFLEIADDNNAGQGNKAVQPGLQEAITELCRDRLVRASSGQSVPEIKWAMASAVRTGSHKALVQEMESAKGQYKELVEVPAGWDLEAMAQQLTSDGRMVHKQPISDPAVMAQMQALLDATLKKFKHFVTYVGFGQETVPAVLKEHDRNADGCINIKEFEDFVGRMGGISSLFEKRREAVTRATDRGTSIPKGSRVRAFHYEDKQKSDMVWDGRVVEVSALGETVTIEFNVPTRSVAAGKDEKYIQEVPLEWIAEDLDLIQSLCAIGILDDAQHYWTILLPASEQYVVKDLAKRQKDAIFGVRRQAMLNHDQAVLQLLERGSSIGLGSADLWSVLTWVRDLAPVIVHVDLDAVLEFLEQDTHYRNQFETSSSKGLLCPQKREEWERNLFGGCYDEAEPFERPKYGVLDVMNDPRGVLCARDYGDSYLLLKNARLRCTFSPVDSGGICGDRLAVLDAYAHVLMEFSDDELREVCRVATAKEGSPDRIGDSTKLDGFNYKEAQIHGELDLSKHVKRLVAHPRHLVDGMDEGRIRKLCTKHGWEFTWMHEERKRRIYEERQAQDGTMLEMSWASQDRLALPEAFLQANMAGRRTNTNLKADEPSQP